MLLNSPRVEIADDVLVDDWVTHPNEAMSAEEVADRSPPAGLLLAQATRIMVLVAICLGLAYFTRSFLLPVLLAAVAAMALKPPVRWLGRFGLPMPLAATLVLGTFVAAVGFGVYNLGRPAVKWVASGPENVARLKEKFGHILRPAARLSAAASSVGNLGNTGDSTKKAPAVQVTDNRVAGSVFSWTGGLLAGIIETVALLFLLLATGDIFLQKLVRVLPTRRDKKRAVEISHEIQQSLSSYLFSVGLINVGFGLVVGLIFHLLGLPNAAMWGGVAAFVNFLPYFGPILGMIAVAMAGLLASDTLAHGLFPAIAYAVLHLVDANLITPVLLGRRCTLNPVVIFLTLVFFMWLWGVVGALLAMPLLVTAKVVAGHLPALSWLDEFLGS